MDDLWGEVMQKCLQRAENLLDKETAPAVETVEAVKGLVETAIAIGGSGNKSPIGPSTVYAFKDGKVRKEKISSQSSSSLSASG